MPPTTPAMTVLETTPARSGGDLPVILPKGGVEGEHHIGGDTGAEGTAR